MNDRSVSQGFRARIAETEGGFRLQCDVCKITCSNIDDEEKAAFIAKHSVDHPARIVIVGGPRTGKTTKAETFGLPVRHLDDLIERHAQYRDVTAAQAKNYNWSEVSQLGSEWLDNPAPWVVEGTAAARALRKWLKRNPEGKPCDEVHLLNVPLVTLTPGQATMGKGCDTVWREIEPELQSRGVTIHKTDFEAPSEDLSQLSDEDLRSRLRVPGITDEQRRAISNELIKRYQTPLTLASPPPAPPTRQQQQQDAHIAANRRPYSHGPTHVHGDGRPKPKEGLTFRNELEALVSRYFNERDGSRVFHDLIASGHIPPEHCK